MKVMLKLGLEGLVRKVGKVGRETRDSKAEVPGDPIARKEEVAHKSLLRLFPKKPVPTAIHTAPEARTQNRHQQVVLQASCVSLSS